MAWFVRIALALAAVALAALALSGPGTRFELFAYQFGFVLLRTATYAGLAAAVLALVALCIPRARLGRGALLALALILGLASAAPPLEFRRQAGQVPRINDISTDFANPAFADEQRKGYPDLRPLALAEPRDQAFAKALATGQAMGWEIAKADAAAGRFNAVATTTWFGFKDDIEVRVSAAGQGSQVDMRSKSRVGRSDIGANAKRIRTYFERLK